MTRRFRQAGLHAIVLLFGTLIPGASALAIAVGDQAPAFVLPAKDGSISLETLRGQWVYLDFWASWCGPCKQSFPWMNEMHAKYSARGLRVVAIDVDAKTADGERFLATLPAKFAVAFDPKGDVPKQYAIKAMPTSLLIDPSGRVTLVHAGFRDEDRAALETAISNALSKVKQ